MTCYNLTFTQLPLRTSILCLAAVCDCSLTARIKHEEAFDFDVSADSLHAVPQWSSSCSDPFSTKAVPALVQSQSLVSNRSFDSQSTAPNQEKRFVSITKTLLGLKEEPLALVTVTNKTNINFEPPYLKYQLNVNTFDSPCLDADVGSQSHEHQ